MTQDLAGQPPEVVPPEVVRHEGPDAVAEALAARLVARLAALQSEGATPQVCLTGGRIARITSFNEPTFVAGLDAARAVRRPDTGVPRTQIS